MKTLYSRFAITTIFIMFLSGLMAFLLSNVYYQIKLKPVNDQKITKITESIRMFYLTHSEVDVHQYLTHVSELGYQIILTDKMKTTYYGKKFNEHNLSPATIEQVINGKTYHGIREFPKQAFVTGFFDDESKNTIGVPIKIKEKRYALFVRPDIGYQLGEMRIFFAVLVSLTIGLSILLVCAGAYYIVKPIRILTGATKKVAQGEYDLQLHVDRTDEIGQLSRHFTQMAQSLQRLDEMRQEFVSNVSHEIQSPLASIQGFAKTLQTSELPSEKRQQYLTIIEKESARLSSLSKQLLTLASLDKETRELELSRFDLASQIKQVILMTAWQWREKELTIEMDLPSTSIKADVQLLHQVWFNLITNSIKFTEHGGTISLRLDSTKRKEVRVLIEDSGLGIPQEELPRIFDRFYKVDKARKRNNPGSGLGLSIVKKIIELHQGSIEVESQEGKGTTFIIRLPFV